MLGNLGRLIGILLLIFVGVFGAYRYISEPQIHSNRPIDNLLHPWDNRVRYRLGSIDPRFGLSVDEVRQLTQEAVQIWHDGTNKDWFVYDENAMLTINLIYDERQIRTNRDKQIKASVEDALQQHNKQSDKLDDKKIKLDQQYANLQQQIDAWQKHHNDIVHQLNQTTDPQYYQQLLNSYQDTLVQKQQLDVALADYRRQEQDYNLAVDDFNINVKELNTIVDSANQVMTPRQFHKGVFDGKKIEIYEFESVDDLRLTLAHELGHALGLGHHDEPTGLMHAMAGEQDLHNFKLQPADIQLLNERHRHHDD